MDEALAVNREDEKVQLSIQRVGVFLGAEITEVDLTQPLDEATWRAISDAHAEHGVLVFPDQDISSEDLMRFGRYFGDLTVHPFSTSVEDNPELIVYDNKEGNPPAPTDIWHTDETFRECPPMGTVLCSKVIPEHGGDTNFASMIAIYDGLSDRLQAFLSGLEAVHDLGPFKGMFPDTAEGRRPRILFLADRNILADQAYNAFSAFPNDAITRIDPDTIRKNGGKPPRNASLFFTIFQTFMTGEGEPVYKQYPPEFFDFIVIDECHRGGAKDESEWRHLLEYFEPAAQLGLTATPKRKHNADTYAYFREPVYTYALRDGIEDGFLTPFKVRQMASTIDEYVYDGSDELIGGDVEAGEKFGEGDFNRRIIIPERELSRVKEFMGQMDQRQKTLVFCATQNHAALVRDLINQVKDGSNPNYCHRVTADDGAVGEQHLRDFQDNDKTIPTILTTSQKLSTGVDARNIRHIVLMRPIRSMIEFKQIIGRGTRTYEGKDFFTIWDFVKAHEKFNDPEWDGEPLAPELPDGPHKPPVEPEPEPGEPDKPDERPEDPPREKIVVKLSDGSVRKIQYIASTTYWSPEGKPISAAEFLERLFGDLSGIVADEDQLRAVWSDPDNRAHFLEQLSDRGYDQDRLDDIRRLVDAPDSDLFDVLGYVLFTLGPKTRQERADRLRQNGLSEFDGELRDLLLGTLRAYESRGESELASTKLGHYLTAKYGSVSESRAHLGEPSVVKDAYRAMQAELYAD